MPPIDVVIPVADASSLGLDVAIPATSDLVLTYWPHHLVMQGLEIMHVTTGLPYWATIIATTVALRSLMLPLAIGGMRNSANMQKIKPELDMITARLNADPLAKSDTKRQLMYRAQMNALFVKGNCNPFKAIVFPIVQIPLFMSFFFGLKGMGDYYPVSSYHVYGHARS